MENVTVLVSFFGSNIAKQVISPMILQPDMVIPICTERLLSEKNRKTLNHFFHRKGMETVVTEPLVLDETSADGGKAIFRERLGRYIHQNLFLDMTEATPQAAMMIGELNYNRDIGNLSVFTTDWDRCVLRTRSRNPYLRKYSWPKLTTSEIRFLNGIDGEFEIDPTQVFRRSELTRPMVKGILAVSDLLKEQKEHYVSVSQHLCELFDDKPESMLDFYCDEARLPVSRTDFQELYEKEILRDYSVRGHVVQFSVSSYPMRRILFHMDRVPIYRMFLEIADLKNSRGSAAYHDLMLLSERYISCIRQTQPYFMASAETMHLDNLFRFYRDARSLFGSSVRCVLIGEVKDYNISRPLLDSLGIAVIRYPRDLKTQFARK